MIKLEMADYLSRNDRSSSLDAIDKLEIGLYDRTSDESVRGFLRIGVMKAVLYRLGNTPVENERLKRCVRNGETSAATFFNTVDGRTSQNDCLSGKRIMHAMTSSLFTVVNWLKRPQPGGAS